MMPVPSEAGCISTFAAPWRPITVWCSVPFFELHLEQLAARLFHRLLHRDRNLARLALAHADAAVAVADHGERGEAEHAAALHHLGDAVDRDHLLAQPVAALFLLLHPRAWILAMDPR